MTVQIHCSCGKVLRAEGRFAGRLVACPNCGARMRVPRTGHRAISGKIRLQCECGEKLTAPRHLAGGKVKCPMCEAVLSVPGPTSTLSGEGPSDELDFADGRQCPDCGITLAGGVAICTQCGANSETGDRHVGDKEDVSNPCPMCGKSVPDYSAICMECGTNVVEAREASSGKGLGTRLQTIGKVGGLIFIVALIGFVGVWVAKNWDKPAGDGFDRLYERLWKSDGSAKSTRKTRNGSKTAERGSLDEGKRTLVSGGGLRFRLKHSAGEVSIVIDSYYDPDRDCLASCMTPIDANIEGLFCNDREIELRSSKVTGGLVDTMRYGKIKIAFTSMADDSALLVWLTKGQEAAFREK